MELILSRKHLIIGCRGLHIDKIELTHFHETYFSMFDECTKISFRDRDGILKVLKNLIITNIINNNN